VLLAAVQVAVKCVAVRSESEFINFLREVECLAAVRHPNVVPFLGAVLQVGQDSFWFLSNYCPWTSTALTC
jgi:serine/threonine protein kinase